jgi:hypothetical protein
MSDRPGISYIRRLSLILVALFISAPACIPMATAETGRLEVDTSEELRTFITTYRCAVVERLEVIHANRERDTDRFLVLALKASPQSYVQCLFLDGDSRMLCEASSGFYAQLPVENRRFRMSPEGLVALARLGFSTDDSDGNYQRMIDIRSNADLVAVADLILSAFYEVYGARTGSQMKWVSPLAKIDALTSSCTPIG